MERVDVLVVGAGPAGAAAARMCVQKGLKTVLIDKHPLPRRKACSGIISNASQNYVLENFGPIPEGAFGRPYISKGMAFYFPSVGTVFADVDCYNLYVWRDRFDHFLALSSGADLRDKTRLLYLEQAGDGVRATVRRDGKEEKLQARFLIGADGGNSHVVRCTAPEVYKGMPWAFACQKYFEGEVEADDRYLYWFLARNMGPFPWLNLKDGQIIIGLAMLHGQQFRPRFDLLVEFLKKNFRLRLGRELATEACLANTMTPLNRFFPGRGRVLLAGDAMGLMHQGGEGISCALASGGLAGEAVAKALEQGADALAEYKRRVRPEMETALDQFNPLRMRGTTASDTSRQPSLLHALPGRQKALAIRDTLLFLRGEFKVEGMASAVLKNMLHRLLRGQYKVPAVD